ncbi:hypothetical protein [Streptomyces sp. rh34]|uniref:hypothetical protein n=1 Tax=Streptomyces sp. rh34 TaxID=2034272 RepID=UPI00117E3453|nr:hypothetical protein [Streptomyces sp. rh34]
MTYAMTWTSTGTCWVVAARLALDGQGGAVGVRFDGVADPGQPVPVVPDRRRVDGAHGAAAAVTGGVDVLVEKSAAHRARVGDGALEEDQFALAWQKA